MKYSYALLKLLDTCNPLKYINPKQLNALPKFSFEVGSFIYRY